MVVTKNICLINIIDTNKNNNNNKDDNMRDIDNMYIFLLINYLLPQLLKFLYSK